MSPVSLRRSGPSERPGVITTIWSQRPPKCNYDDLVPASAQVSLRRSGPSDRPHELRRSGPSDRSERNYNDLVQANAIRSCLSVKVPWVRFGNETSSFVITSHKQRAVFEGGIFQRKSGAASDPVPLGATSCHLHRSGEISHLGTETLMTIRSHRARPAVIYNDLVKDDFPVPASSSSRHPVERRCAACCDSASRPKA